MTNFELGNNGIVTSLLKNQMLKYIYVKNFMNCMSFNTNKI